MERERERERVGTRKAGKKKVGKRGREGKKEKIRVGSLHCAGP